MIFVVDVEGSAADNIDHRTPVQIVGRQSGQQIRGGVHPEVARLFLRFRPERGPPGNKSLSCFLINR